MIHSNIKITDPGTKPADDVEDDFSKKYCLRGLDTKIPTTIF